MLGCTNPKAANYDPAATQDDGSCVYVEYKGPDCVEFMDVPASELVDESFTLSYSFESKDWVFFHDYFPDMYFSTRNALYSLKNSKVYKHNIGAPGVYYDGVPKSFFIDAAFASDQEMTLNALSWISEVFDGTELEFATLTHITIWNGQQCSGRVALTEAFKAENLEYPERRKTQSLWSFNAFRDIVIERGSAFIKDIFNNFAVIDSQLSSDLPWYEQKLLEGNYFIVRFEFDNVSGNDFVLHAVDSDISKSYR